MIIVFNISDPITFLISMVGIILSLFYIFKKYCSCVDAPGYDEELKKALDEWLKNEKKDLSNSVKLNLVLKDYGTATSEMGRRDNITLLVGTILITASLLILGGLISNKPSGSVSVYALVSIGSFFLWFFILHDTSKSLNDLSYERIKAIEQALTEFLKQNSEKGEEKAKKGYAFGIHSYIFEKTLIPNKRKTVRWLRLRRTFWAWVLLLLSIAWISFSMTLQFIF